jgi:hypothetical protein
MLFCDTNFISKRTFPFYKARGDDDVWSVVISTPGAWHGRRWGWGGGGEKINPGLGIIGPASCYWIFAD